MKIFFKTRKFTRICSNTSARIAAYGEGRGKKLGRRLDDLQAAGSLEDMRNLFPGRCHELHGDREGTLALDLGGPCRLIVEPADDPIPTKEDGGLDWTQVRSIRVLEIEEDYHG